MASRLDTPLSKALIESGILDPSAVEDAAQEQMIHGGALDTILLEKGAVDERTLADLLAQAWSTEPVPIEAIERPAASAVKALPERMALAMKLCPFAVEGTAIHVMCASPLDRALIEEVSGLLLKPLVPHVVPEVRVWQGLQHAYGTTPDERFAALLVDLQAPHARAAAGGDTEEGDAIDDMKDVSDPGAARWDLLEALAHLASQDSKDGIARIATSYARKFLPFAAMVGVRSVDGGTQVQGTPSGRVSGRIGADDEARAFQCVGWLRSGPAEGVQFANKPFVVGDDCVLDGALRSPSPSLGKPAITSGNAALFGWLGRRRPRTFLVVPIVVVGKPVGALLADGGIRARDFASMSDLVSFGARLGPAFETLLRSRRAQTVSALPQPASALPQPALPEAAAQPLPHASPDFPPFPSLPPAPSTAPAPTTSLDAITKPHPVLRGEAPRTIPEGAPPPLLSSSGPSQEALPTQPTRIGTLRLGADTIDSMEASAQRGSMVQTSEETPSAREPSALREPSAVGAPLAVGAPSTANMQRKRTAAFIDIHTEVTAPQPLMAGLGPGRDLGEVDAVPAPPAAPSIAVGAVGSVPPDVGSMPPAELAPPRRDGTSPFARNYVVNRTEPPPAPPPAPPPPPMPIVSDSLASGLAGIDSHALAHAVFADVDDEQAVPAWQGALAEAVERGHQGGTVQPEEKARIFLDDDGWEDIRYDSYDAPSVSQSGEGVVVTGGDAAISMPLIVSGGAGLVESVDAAADIATVGDGEPITDDEEPSPLEQLVDALDSEDAAVVEKAKKQLLHKGADALAVLEEKFPGRLLVDPFDPGENVRTAQALSPLVELLYALGAAGLDAVVPHLDSRYPAHRFAAVLLFALTPDARGIDLLRARLHDQEPRIRQLAAEALAPFVAHPRFEAVLVHLRERSQSPLLDARRRAVQLLGAFRDVGGVPLLIALLETGAKASSAELIEDTRHALRAITLQDFGVRARGWEKWWSKAKKKSRVDWLIEGLLSEDRELRAIAHVELAAIAGDDFGYRPDEPRRKRAGAVAVFQTWWADEQKRPKAS